MRRLIIVAGLLALATGCRHLVEHSLNKVSGSGVYQTETRNVTGFKGLSVSGGFLVEIAIGKDERVEVTSDDNLLSHIKTEVRSGVLHVSTEGGDISFARAPQLKITMPELQSLESSGACQVNVAQLRTENLKVKLNGASKLTATGEIQTLTADLNGASRINAKDLRAADVTVSANGASQAEVFASASLTADANGASRISYFGKPGQVTPKKNGASSVTAAE